MNKLKRTLSTILMLCLTLNLLSGTAWAAGATSGTCGTSTTWRFDESTGTLTISGTGETDDFAWSWGSNAPWNMYQDEIQFVLIESGVTRIGNGAFGGDMVANQYDNLKTISLPATLESIGQYAFAGSGITSVYLPNGLKRIEDGAFYGTALTTLSLPSSLTSVGAYAFSGSPLTSVHIPASVAEIGECAFGYGVNIESITVDPKNPYFTAADQVLYDSGKTKIILFGNQQKLYTIPSTIETIDLSTFWYAENLEGLVIPDGVELTDNYEFSEGVIDLSTGFSLYFCGDAPDNLDSLGIMRPSAGGYVRLDVYYVAGTNGWDQYTGKDYYDSDLGGYWKTFDTWTPDSTAAPAIQKLYPANGATEVGCGGSSPEHYQITFDREIANDGAKAQIDLSRPGAFSIYRASDDKPVFQSTQYHEGSFLIVYQNENILSITGTQLDPETEYYVTMDAGIVTFKDGTTNSAIKKGDWVFTTKVYVPTLYGSDFTMGVDSLGFNNYEGYYYISDEHLNILYSKGNSVLDHIRITRMGLKMKLNCKGVCFGMSSLMQQMKLGVLTPSEFSANNVFSLPDSKKVDSLISYYQTAQVLSCFANADSVDKKKSQEELVMEIINSLKAEPIPILVNIQFYQNRKWNDHTVLAFAVDLNSNADYYLISIADPNAMVRRDQTSGQTVSNNASIMYIDKTSLAVEKLRHDTWIDQIKITSVYSGSDAELLNNLNPNTAGYYTSSTLLETMIFTTDLKFSVAANGKNANVNVDKIDGDLEIFGPYYMAEGDNSGLALYYVEPAEKYCISYLDTNDKTVMISFADDKALSYVESTANIYEFDSAGTTSIGGSTGVSSITVPFSNNHDDMYMLTITCDNSDMSVLAGDGICEIDSSTLINILTATGQDDWNTTTLSAQISKQKAYISAIKEIDSAKKLRILNNEKVILNETEAKYSVSFMSNGGSFVDTITNISYGLFVNAPVAPIKDGYTFAGWYTDDGQAWNFSKDTVTGNTILYAKWVPNSSVPQYPSHTSSLTTYTITTPTTSGGTIAASPKNASKGTTITITVKPDDGYELDSLTVTDASGNKVSLTKKSDTKYTFTMPASKVNVKASFEEIENDAAMSNPFIDVSSSAYYYDAVLWAVDNGITSGTSATTFSPDAVCTRAQAMTFLWKAAGSPEPKNTENPFADVLSSNYYCKAVLWAVEQGITAGTSVTTFSPDETCTRAQIMTFLYRTAGTAAAGNNPFTDVADSAYYADAVKWAVAEGITAGTSAATFSPDQACTRAQIMTFLYKCYNQ